MSPSFHANGLCATGLCIMLTEKKAYSAGVSLSLNFGVHLSTAFSAFDKASFNFQSLNVQSVNDWRHVKCCKYVQVYTWTMSMYEKHEIIYIKPFSRCDLKRDLLDTPINRDTSISTTLMQPN